MKPRSPIEILIDRACGVPDAPDADDVALVTRFAQGIAIEVSDFMCGFLGHKDARLAQMAAVDFVTHFVAERMRAPVMPQAGAKQQGGAR